jgi:hypothetical protein
MEMMTDEEADALYDYYTKNPPKLDPTKNRLANKPFRMVVVDDFSADYITTKARIANTTPTEVIADLVRQQVAAHI